MQALRIFTEIPIFGAKKDKSLAKWPILNIVSNTGINTGIMSLNLTFKTKRIGQCYYLLVASEKHGILRG